MNDSGDRACILFRAGKNRDGYFANKEILAQLSKAMDILDEDTSSDHHVFIYDNATTHRKRPLDGLTSKQMPLNPPAAGRPNFLCREKVDGKVVKEVPMRPGKFADGSNQSFYFEPGHPKAGLFKGMRQIILERHERDPMSAPNPQGLLAQCKNFKCPVGVTTCCCRRVLFHQPDFNAQKSSIEELCESRGYGVIFLPKFHCELNFIEQCWGYAKRLFRELPNSRNEADLERKVLAVLDAVPLSSMRR
jgi:hypothetical protein